ncbi:MAG: hypothetical protein MSS19_04575, partial [Collinsella sp.]|nr:hypothetical protein [Collinsella sp.]
VFKKAPSQISCPKRTSPAPTMATSQVEHKSANARQSEHGDVNAEGIGLLAMPCILNDKLSFWAARSVNWLRGS